MRNAEMKDIRGSLVFWSLTLCYMGLIFFFSSRSTIKLPDLTIGLDKILHACAYMILAFLSYISINKSGVRKYVFISAFLFAGLYGISDEIHQSFVPGRDASFGDLTADFLGALAGCTGAKFIKGKTSLF